MSSTPRFRKKELKLVALVALPLSLLWAIHALYVKQVGPLAPSVDVAQVVESVDRLAFERDGRHLWVFTSREVQQWDVQTKQKTQAHPSGTQHSFPPPSPPFLSADGQTLMTSDRDDRDCFYVKLWDTRTGQLKRSLRVSGSMQYQRNAALSLNGILATQNFPKQSNGGGSFGEEIKIWDAKSGALLKLIQLPSSSSQGSATVSSLALSNDGTTVVAGLQEGIIWVWDARSGRELGKWKDGSADILLSKTANSSFSVVPGVYQVALSPDGQVLATASGDDTVRLWQPRTGKLLHIIHTPTGQNQPPLLFSPNGRWLASAGTRMQASYMRSGDLDGRVWDVQTGKLHARLKGHEAAIAAFSFSPDSASLASADEKGVVKLWSIT